MNELDQIIARWNSMADGTMELLRSLPDDSYDYRPDPGARSIGELAWHLAEIDGYTSLTIERRATGERPPNITRPKTIAELAPAYELVHREAVQRIRTLTPADLDAEVQYVDGRRYTIRNLLRERIVMHAVHHRGQLSVLCRLAGGIAPGLAGPAREDAGSLTARRAAQLAS